MFLLPSVTVLLRPLIPDLASLLTFLLFTVAARCLTVMIGMMVVSLVIVLTLILVLMVLIVVLPTVVVVILTTAKMEMTKTAPTAAQVVVVDLNHLQTLSLFRFYRLSF